MSHHRLDWISLSIVVNREVERWSWLHLDNPSLHKCFQFLCILATGLIFFLKSSSDLVLNPSLNATVIPDRKTVYRGGHSLLGDRQWERKWFHMSYLCLSFWQNHGKNCSCCVPHQWKHSSLNQQFYRGKWVNYIMLKILKFRDFFKFKFSCKESSVLKGNGLIQLH